MKDVGRLARDRAKVEAGPRELVEFVGDDPGWAIVHPEPPFDRARQGDGVPLRRRLRVRDRHNQHRRVAGLVHARDNDGAGTILAALIQASAPFVVPEIGVADDKARYRLRQGHDLLALARWPCRHLRARDRSKLRVGEVSRAQAPPLRLFQGVKFLGGDDDDGLPAVAADADRLRQRLIMECAKVLLDFGCGDDRHDISPVQYP